jgi:F420H(2)-dependent quinone reductase
MATAPRPRSRGTWPGAPLGNRLVAWVLRSPLHRLASRDLALTAFRGRRSGRWFTTPVSYVRDGGRVLVLVGNPERQRWRRNLRQPAPVRLRLAGREVEGVGAVLARGSAEPTDALGRYLRRRRRSARARGVRLAPDGTPDAADPAGSARQATLVEIRLGDPAGHGSGAAGAPGAVPRER